MSKKLFDFSIGNPPYQDQQNQSEESENLRNYAPPVYNLFLDEAYKVADKVEMIHPARFLFNAGSTPKAWNEKMLNDPHLKVLCYEPDSSKIFSNTDIKGGIAITFYDENENFGAIEIFTQYPELNTILSKVRKHPTFSSFSEIVYSRTSYRFTQKLHEEHPEAMNKLSKGHAYDVSSNILTRLADVFFDEIPEDGNEYITILGRESNKRVYKFLRRDYLNNVDNFEYYKVFVPQAGGTGQFGEPIGQPIVEGPKIGATETFISMGKCAGKDEAEHLMKYIKSKFARALLSVLKVTQNGNKPVWAMIPLQNFTASSDIDWNKSIHDVDLQLYRKYGLNTDEVAFIESNVKEME